MHQRKSPDVFFYKCFLLEGPLLDELSLCDDADAYQHKQNLSREGHNIVTFSLYSDQSSPAE